MASWTQLYPYAEKIFSRTSNTDPVMYSVCGIFLKHKRNDIIDFKDDL